MARKSSAQAFYTMLEEHLAVPFETEILGIRIAVMGIELTDDGQIVAVCARGRLRQRIAILDLPLPRPVPDGAGIEACRAWARAR